MKTRRTKTGSQRRQLEWLARQLNLPFGGPLRDVPTTSDVATAPATIVNQCDGCRAGMPIVNGNHRDKNDVPYMGCTAERYS